MKNFKPIGILIPRYYTGTDKNGIQVNNSNDALSVEDFITLLINAKIKEAYNKSRTRTKPAVPLIGGTKNPQTPELFDSTRKLNLAKYLKLIKDIESLAIYNFTTGKKDIPMEFLKLYDAAKRDYDAWNNATYQSTRGGAIAPSCLYTATDNFGSKYLQASNNLFMSLPASISGFTKINNSKVNKGDIVIRSENDRNHAMIYSGRDNRGPTYNHSNGGTEPSDYRINAHYPATNDQLNTYRFTGTHNDSVLWKKQYYDKYGI